MADLELHTRATFEWKIGLLMKACIKAFEANRFAELAALMTVMNRMQGHEQPTKVLNTNINANIDIKQDQERVRTLLLEYERDY